LIDIKYKAVMKSQFYLDPNITFLNHGSFGACPKPIFENYQYWQLELEKEPVQFITKKYFVYLKQSKLALAKFIGCEEEDFFLTPNPTTGINTIMRSLVLKDGDEILSTNNEYGAMDRTWNFFFKKSGVKYVKSPISLPIISKEKIIEDFWKGYTPQTKAIFINQISSATALIMPIKEICDKARALGLLIIIDGAHTPGHISLNIKDLDPDFYTGTCHKWMLAPKGCSFLYAKKDKQHLLDPLVVSWGYESDTPSASRFLDYHQHQGTKENSAYLTIPAAIEFLEKNNWKEKTDISKQLILDNYPLFCDLLNTHPICPVTSEFLGQMCSIPIHTPNPVELKELLYSKYHIEIPIMPHNGKTYMRITFTPYNSQVDLDTLRLAIIDIIKTTNLILI
jgi:isopenicillin-N epimerase